MRKWYPLFLIAAAATVSLIVYPRLPERVPTHWNLRGEIDAYGSRLVPTLLMPVALLLVWGLMRVLPSIDPRRRNFEKMQGAYETIVNGALTLLAAMHVVILAMTMGMPIDITRIMPVMIGFLFIVMGNVMPRARPNFWFGIRTPWTLSNDRVWERTHRVGGYVMVCAGLLMVACGFFPSVVAAIASFVVLGVSVAATIVYSFVAWKQETSKGVS
jgi:uncharacterized membrane protein